jgi:hypothetical protein
MASALTAHIALVEGDTAAALNLFTQLEPTARRGSLPRPWESLGLERLAHARVLLARGEYEQAYRVATVFDSPGGASIIYLTFLRASLELRLEAARELGWEEKVGELAGRILRLGTG